MPVKIIKATQAQGIIKKQVAGKEVQTVEPVGEPKALEHPCNVGFSANYTKNLGNYESLKVGVSLHMPCEASEIDDVLAFEKRWVDKKMTEVLEDVAPEAQE